MLEKWQKEERVEMREGGMKEGEEEDREGGKEGERKEERVVVSVDQICWHRTLISALSSQEQANLSEKKLA